MIDTRNGFIVTYYKSNPDSERILKSFIEALSARDYYLVLASHSYDVPLEIQKMCDFYFYQELNVVDNRKYSHGVAENNLIEIALHHLLHKGIQWTYKTSYDVDIKDFRVFDKWQKDFEYSFVTCKWGNLPISTHSFFASVNFLIDYAPFYRTVEEMMRDGSYLEECWYSVLGKKGLMNEIFSFESKQDFYEVNSMDMQYYNYSGINFYFNREENKFYVENDFFDFFGDIKIFDYYSDLCLYHEENFNHPRGITMWIIPPFIESLPLSKNGFYLEMTNQKDGFVIRRNYDIKDFELKDPLHKAYKTFKHVKDQKYHEYSELNDFRIYEDFGIDLDLIRNFVDLGANFGLASVPFIKANKKVYMIDPDTRNVDILTKAFGRDSKVKIIPKAVSSVDGEVSFYMDEVASVVSSLEVGVQEHERSIKTKITVESISPDTMINKEVEEDYIDLIKIDIEGAEYEFFDSVSDSAIKKIKSMIIEFHFNHDYRVMSILKKLAKNDFDFSLHTWGSFTNPYVIENKMGIIYARQKD